jgi:hypothetical protein
MTYARAARYVDGLISACQTEKPPKAPGPGPHHDKGHGHGHGPKKD